MTCSEHTERLSLLLDNLLDGDDRAEAQRHLQGCPQCRRTWAAMQYVDWRFRQSPRQHPPPGFTQRTVAAAVQRRQRDNLVFGSISLLVGTVLVGGLVLATTFGLSGMAWALIGAPSLLADSPNLLGRLWELLVVLGSTAWTLLSIVRQVAANPIVAATLLILMVGGLGVVARLMRSNTRTTAPV
jgi:anti-sigma factor RsiW